MKVKEQRLGNKKENRNYKQKQTIKEWNKEIKY